MSKVVRRKKSTQKNRFKTALIVLIIAVCLSMPIILFKTWNIKYKSKKQKLIYMMEKDILASNIYTLGYEYDSKANLDYTKKLIVN